MILQDFQRGRLPYFNPPPKSEALDTDQDKNKDTPTIVDGIQTVIKDPKVPKVKQDFKNLNIGPDFEGEDLDNKNVEIYDDTEAVVRTDESDSDTGSDTELIDNSDVISDSEDSKQAKLKNFAKNISEISEQSVDVPDEEFLDKNLISNLTKEERSFLGFEDAQSK